MRAFFKRQSIVPFEVTFAVFSIYSGLAGLLNFGVVNAAFQQALGYRLSFVFNLAYFIAGLALYIGTGANLTHIEAFGLIFLITSLVVRSIVVFNELGLSAPVLGTHIFATVFVVACVVRFHSIRKGRDVVETTALKEVMKEIGDLKAKIPLNDK